MVTPTTGGDNKFIVTSNVVPGKTYNFKVKALNEFGEGNFSDPIPVIAASVPD